MLPRQQRLRTDRQVRQALRTGHRRSSPNFSVRVRPQTDGPRFAFVVSRQVSKRAVIRNKLRRRLREIVRPIPPVAADIVIMARPSALKLNYDQLRQEILSLLVSRPRVSRHYPTH